MELGLLLKIRFRYSSLRRLIGELKYIKLETPPYLYNRCFYILARRLYSHS